MSSELRKAAPKETACASGDVCGFFLQLVSPGSSPTDLSNKAARMIEGKCGGHVIVYKDARNVLGSGTVLASADDKRACERALGREKADTDFPNAMVWRVAK